MKKKLQELIQKQVLILDGAMGTEIQKRENIKWGRNAKGESLAGCTEALNLYSPQIIDEIYTSYLQAGANIITSNTFGAMEWVLAEYEMQEHSKEIAKLGVQLAKEAILKHKPLENQKDALFVAGSLGPGTKLPSLGHIDYDTMFLGYCKVVSGFKEANVDLILLETAQDPLQIKAALHAIREIDKEIPIMVSATIETNGSMLIGTDIATLFYILVSLALYFTAAFMLNRLTAVLSPIPVLIFILYAYAKRFTNFCHVILGIALGLAPICAWIAVTGSIDTAPFILGGAVILWVAGFDILYAIQDIEYDRKEGLHSIPAVFGTGGSLIIARILHFAAICLFISLMAFTNLGYIYLAGVLLSGALMAYEHSLVSKDDLSKLNMAFFNMNAYISITIMIFTIIDIWVGK